LPAPYGNPACDEDRYRILSVTRLVLAGQDSPLPPGRPDLLADPHPPIVPAAFRKLDAVAVLTGLLSPARLIDLY
jgi:hypothetical protein